MRGRALRALATAGKSLALGTIFVSAAVTGVLIHSNAKATRRLAASIANGVLAGPFLGKVVVGDVTHLAVGRTSHVRVGQVEIFDPEGRRVVLAKGVDAKLDLVRLVRSVASGRAPDIALTDETRIADADVALDVNAKGELGIARAFEARPRATPTPESPAKPGAESVRLSIPGARIGHAWVHGNLVPPALDVDADDVKARLLIVDNRLSVDADELRVSVRSPRAPSQTGPVRARVFGSLLVPLGSPPASSSVDERAIVMHWELEGDAAGVPMKAHFGLNGDAIDASADIARVAPDVLRKALPVLPITKESELHAKATGNVRELALEATGAVGASAVTAKGRVGLAGRQTFEVDADLTHIDGAALSGPASDVSGHVRVEGALASGAPTGTFTLTTRDSSIAGQRAPALDAIGRFDDRVVEGTFRASEPGAAASGEVELRIPEQKLVFGVRARSNDLRALARAPGVAGGSVSARATGTIDLAESSIDARVTVDGNGIAHAPMSAGSVHAEASITGPVADPVIDVTARARQVRLTAASTDPDAKPKEPLTYPAATARARIVLSPTPTLRDAAVHVEAAETGTSIDAKVASVAVGPRGVDARGVRVTGLGAPLDADVQIDAGVLSVKAKGEGVDMTRLAAMTGIEELRRLPDGSRARVDVDLRAGASRTDGHIDLVIAGAEDGSTAELYAKLEGRHVRARARVRAAGFGWVEMQRAELELPGALSVATMRRATGALDLRGELDLAQGASMFGGEHLEQIAGTAVISARVERGDVSNAPTIYATVVTRGLDATLVDEKGKPTHIRGIDGSVHVGYDGATDETEVAALAWDGAGIVASADTKGRVPLVGWATGAKPFDRKTVGAIHVAGVVDVPPREVAALPGELARSEMLGTLSAHAEIGGAIDRPSVQLVARADALREKKSSTAGARFAPIDGVLDARWDGDGIVASLTVDERERLPRKPSPARAVVARGAASRGARTSERKSGHARGLFIAALPVGDLIAGRPLAWTAAGEVDVTDLELAPLPLPRNIRGALSGHVRLREIEGLPVLVGSAHVTDLGIGGASVMRGDLTVDAKDGALSAHASVRQADGGGGEANIVSSSLRWRGIAMKWDDAQPSRVDYTVDRLQLSLLRPFVRNVVAEIEGRLDGKGSAVVDAKSHVYEGGLALEDGRLYVNAIGEEITNISGSAKFERDGTFRVQDMHGKIGSGELKASASGRMKGLRFESAEMVVVVPTKQGVPVSSEGATFAEATGEVRLTATMAPDREALLVAVAVPRSKITLPDRGTQDLQPLEPDATIKVGIRRGDGTLAPEPQRPGRRRRRVAAATATNGTAGAEGDGLTTKLSVTLGNDVALEGRGLRLHLDGRTIVEIADEIAVKGQITLRAGGTIDVQGRKFVVDHGTVTFVDGAEPSNPTVIAAAYWDAPDRTRVWVEFNGPLKTGKLMLRSEPAYSKNEILSVLLFGRTDPNQARAGDARSSDAQAATAVGTGIASAGLNKALGELDEDLDLEQDSTSANRVRTKLGYRLRRNLKVQLGYAAGFSQREPDTTYLFLEWQFVPKWSVVGTRGDRGTSILDIIFQHRY